MDLSFIVLTQNGWQVTLACLESLASVVTDYAYEVIVVDNGSSDGMRDHLSKCLSRMNYHYVRLENNVGAALGRNIGADSATGNLLAFIDNDATIEAAFVDEAVHFFEKRSDVDACQCKIMRARAPAEIENAGFTLDMFGFGYTVGFGEIDRGQYDVDRFIMGGVTSGLIVRQPAFADVRGLDNRMFYQFEDADLCWRLWRFGHAIAFCHSIKVFHLNGGTIPRNPRYLKLYARNRIWSLARNLDGASSVFSIAVSSLYCLGLAALTLFLRGPLFSLGVLSGLAAGLRGIQDSRKLRADEAHAIVFRTKALLTKGVLTAPSLRVIVNARFLPTWGRQSTH
jgi:GT2 family glycosyltransferase